MDVLRAVWRARELLLEGGARVSVRLPPDDLERAREAAKALGVTVSDVIRAALLLMLGVEDAPARAGGEEEEEAGVEFIIPALREGALKRP